MRNTCHDPRTSLPQRDGCLPPHTDRVQQDIRPTDNPAPSAQKSGDAKGDVESRRRRRHPPSAARRRRNAGQLRQPARRQRRATPEGHPRRRLPHRRTPAPRPAPTTTGCAGNRMPCRQQTAPPPSRYSKDVTAHPHRPGARPGRPCPAPPRSGRHRPVKAG